MDLSGLESADAIETKDVSAAPILDRLGSFGMVSSPDCSRIVPAGPDHSYARRSLRKFVRQLFEYAMGCIFLPDDGVSTSVRDTVGREF
jgi:hypothetical protein